MNWNHRVVRVLDCIDERGTAHYTLMFAEVYYNDDGTPMGYGECFMHGDMGELRQLVNRLANAVTHPVLEASEMKDKREHEELTIEEMSEMALALKKVPDLDEDIFEAGDVCPLCGNAETCKECKV